MSKWLTASIACLCLVSCQQEPRIQHVRWSDGDSGSLVSSDGWELKFRLKNVDAPETDGRRYNCDAERSKGEEAAVFVRAFTSSGEIQITRRFGVDSTGRRHLIALSVDGHDVKDALIAEGLGQFWDYDSGAPAPKWCPPNQ